MNPLIEVRRDGAIATVVLNRPEKLNALTITMWRDLGTAIARLSAADDLRCIILRGAGEQAFSPGNDIGEFATVRADKAQATAQRIADGAPLVARWHKKFARRLADPRPLTPAERDECFECFDTEDFRTGYAAFLAKSKPAFKGR
ncbi:MAG: enoyl-CoA hydratase/isomerase family protein [Casimicrobiaceae bacterium]